MAFNEREHPVKAKRPAEKFSKQRRKPKGRARFGEVAAGEDDLIAALTEKGHIHEVLRELRSGKEATAYVAAGPKGPLLLKIYRSPEVRSFQQDGRYREGAHRDARAARAVRSRSRYGLSRLQSEWVAAEYRWLWRLQEADLPAPRPLLGPSLRECLSSAPAVLMTLIGEGEEPAPRLSDLTFDEGQEQEVLSQCTGLLAALLELGLVHGDFSAYNLLWHQEQVHLIDLPQMVTRQNPHFHDLLRRDARNLLSSLSLESSELRVDSLLAAVKQQTVAKS